MDTHAHKNMYDKRTPGGAARTKHRSLVRKDEVGLFCYELGVPRWKYIVVHHAKIFNIKPHIQSQFLISLVRVSCQWNVAKGTQSIRPSDIDSMLYKRHNKTDSARKASWYSLGVEAVHWKQCISTLAHMLVIHVENGRYFWFKESCHRQVFHFLEQQFRERVDFGKLMANASTGPEIQGSACSPLCR